MELGGGLASTPGPFGAALGESLMKATPGLVANQKDLRKEQRDLRKEASELERLENARKEALMSGDRDEFLRKDKEYNDFLDKKQQRVDKNIEAVNTADMENRKVRYDTEVKGWILDKQEAGATKRTAMQVAAQDRATSETRKQTVARGMLETAMKPILAGLKAQMIDDETAYAQAFDQALRKLPKDMQIVLGYTPQERDTGSTMRFDAKGNPI